jgi:pimeloyl-ACP methyl ester carboxylesterase
VSTRFRAWRATRALAAAVAGAALVALTACGGSNEPTYVAHDPTLRAEPLYFYPASSRAARAFVFFFGNDVAFWEPHRALAHRLSGEGYDVVGLDLVPYLRRLPDGPGVRDSAFAHAVTRTIAAARAELHADTLPVVLAGHSFGAEVAFWTAQYAPPPRLAGILALNPRPAGHLYVTLADLGNRIASGPRSFSTVAIAHTLPPAVRIALVRSGRDHFIKYDTAFVPSGGARLRRYVVPLAHHALKGLLIAGPIIDHALAWVVAGAAMHTPLARAR